MPKFVNEKIWVETDEFDVISYTESEYELLESAEYKGRLVPFVPEDRLRQALIRVKELESILGESTR